jgi:hypothetical protein
LQNTVKSDFDGDLVAFVESFHGIAPRISNYFFHLLTEPFLVQLYDLFATPSQVYEARAKLLDWHALRFSDPTSSDRAKTLRINQRIQRVRGEIDDTRVYVDPYRFAEWMDENCLPELSLSLSDDQLDPTKLHDFRDIGDYTHRREPHVSGSNLTLSALV